MDAKETLKQLRKFRRQIKFANVTINGLKLAAKAASELEGTVDTSWNQIYAGILHDNYSLQDFITIKDLAFSYIEDKPAFLKLPEHIKSFFVAYYQKMADITGVQWAADAAPYFTISYPVPSLESFIIVAIPNKDFTKQIAKLQKISDQPLFDPGTNYTGVHDPVTRKLLNKGMRKLITELQELLHKKKLTQHAFEKRCQKFMKEINDESDEGLPDVLDTEDREHFYLILQAIEKAVGLKSYL